jgi:hypothetical protein
MFGKDRNTAKCTHEETRNKLNSGNAIYHSFQNPMPCHLTSKTVILLVLCGSVTWSLTLRVCEKRCWGKYGGAIARDYFQIAVLINSA